MGIEKLTGAPIAFPVRSTLFFRANASEGGQEKSYDRGEKDNVTKRSNNESNESNNSNGNSPEICRGRTDGDGNYYEVCRPNPNYVPGAASTTPPAKYEKPPIDKDNPRRRSEP